MGDPVRYHMRDGVAVVTIAHPPVNALSHAVRAGMAGLIERCAVDGNVKAIVIAAEGRTFPAGADISEFGKKPEQPILPELCNIVEAVEKPVVAAIHGTALGGGFELALAAHARVAEARAVVGLPEVKLGLLPGAGGTQRLPRLAGVGPALDIMLSGEPVAARAAYELGLVDAVVTEDVLGAAITLAGRLADQEVPPLRAREREPARKDPAAWAKAIAERRKVLESSPVLAPKKIIDCVEAVQLLPFDAAMHFERAAFEDLLASDQSAAMRHAFFAERRAAKLPELAGVAPHQIGRIGVLGGGLMGAGVTVACLDAGFPVILVEKDIEALEAGVERVIDIYDRLVARKKLTAEVRDERVGRLSGRVEIEAMAEADFIIEAVVENADVKHRIFAELNAVTRPGTILATNTSYLDINDIAQASGRPAMVVGLHFFSPAQVMRLVEVIPGNVTSPEVTATAFALARKLGKIAVRAGVTDGFIGNRILSAYRKAAEYLLEDGASVVDIDSAMRDFGFPLGPFQVSDLAGLDIAWARRQRLASTRDPDERYVTIPDRLCELGRLGRKVGRGWYAYPRDGDRMGEVDPEVTAIIAEERLFQGITARSFAPEEIQQRCMLAMANEGARLLVEGIARRPSDIDVVMMHGFAYPRWHGGPMKSADLMGLFKVRKALQALAEDAPHLWLPAPIFDDLIKNGKTFNALNEAS